MRLRRRVSIVAVVTLVLVATVSTVMGVFGYLGYRTFRDQAWSRFHIEHSTLADQLAVGLVLPVWNFDRDQIDRILDGAMQAESIVGVVVRLEDEQKSVHARARDTDGRVRPGEPDRRGAEVVRASRTITANASRLGAVEVYATRRFTEEQLRRTRVSLVGALLALDAALVLVLGGLLWRLVLRPLKQIEVHAAGVSALGEGPNVRFAGGPFRGELERLRVSIQSMVQLLAARYQAIERSREELRASEERFRSAMHHSPIGMALLAPDGRWMEVNPALCAIVGYTRDELEARTFAEITHPEDLSGDLALVGDLLNHNLDTFQREKRFIHKDGRVVWIQSNVSIVRDEQGQPRHFVTQIQDVTEQKRVAAEQISLAERRARYESALTTLTRLQVSEPGDLSAVFRPITESTAQALDAARVSIWRATENGNALVCEDGFDRESGRHASGSVLTSERYPALFDDSSTSEVFAPVDPLHDPRFAAFAAGFLKPQGITSFMSAQIRARGVRIGVLACSDVGELRRWTHDEQTFAVAVANLISAHMAQVERQRAEDQLRQAQKMEAVGQLAGGVAHDFNNLLTVIQGKAGQLLEDERIPAQLRQGVVDIFASGERAAALTRQLLTFSRRQAVLMRNVNLNDVVATLARMLDRVLGEDISVDFRYTPEAPSVHADPGMIEQVVLNLVVNARDAMAGGGRIRIETSIANFDPSQPTTGRRRPGQFACIEVSDTGEGIAPEFLPRIFEPFFTTKDIGKGTGLGLATAYGIVQQHGGWIDVESVLGSGTIFRVYLPRTTKAVAAVERVEVPTSAIRGSETILVVEDEHDVRHLVSEALTGFGYRVLEAASGPAALKVWEDFPGPIEMLITDLTMPDGMNGLELARSLRTRNPELKVIFTSGYFAEMGSDELNLGSGATYLPKPFTLEQLGRIVRQTADASGVDRSRQEIPTS